jgi:hypothetical protein
MNRKNSNLAFFTLFIVVLLSSLTLITFAQKTNIPNTEQSQPKCTGEKFVMPSSISLGNIAFADYLKVASLPAKERQIAFSALSNEQKASFIRVNLALQFIKRPNMTKEQQEFLLDAILKVSADLYDTSDAEKVRSSEQSGLEMVNRALGLFTHQDASDFIEPLGTNKNEEVTLLQKYEDLLKNGMKARKKIVREMPVNDRVNIWKTQLVYHLTTANLSQPQRELIVEFLMTLSPATFIRPVNETKEEAAKALEILEKKILSVFSRAEEFAIFEELGIHKIVTDKKENVLEGDFVFCDCLYYCTPPYECGAAFCNVEIKGCGPLGIWYCIKKCGLP